MRKACHAQHQPDWHDTYINVDITDGDAYEQASKLAREAGIVGEEQRPTRISLFNRVWSVAA